MVAMSGNCTLCPDLCLSRTQIVLPTPCSVNGLLAIGEGPGADEDREGRGFCGRAGKTLDALLFEHGITRANYGQANLVRCRPEGNRKPTAGEIRNCQPLLMDSIAEFRPKVLLLVGATSAAAIIGFKGALYDQIQREASSTVVVRNHLCLAVPMPHVSPLAWNRFAPNGERWADIGRRQVALAVGLLAR